MAQNLTTSFASDVKASGAEPVLGIRHREIFWHPRYLRVSRYTAHLPFLFWLIADLRPRRCVTLGLGTGVAHFAICQAVEKLGLEAVCHGVDARDAADLPKGLQDYNSDNYDYFSKLDSGVDPLEAVDHGGIDLLVVDQPLNARLLGQIANEWTAKLSQPAIIVLAGVQKATKDAETARALTGLQQRFDHITFDHDGGLLVLCTAQTGTTDAVADRFHRLARVQAYAKIEAQLDEARAKQASLRSAYDARHSQMATVQAEMFDLKSALQAQIERNDQLEHDLGIARTVQAKFVEQIAAGDNRIAELSEAQDQEAASRAELQQVVINRDNDIQLLIQRIETAEEALKTNQAMSAEWEKERQTLTADLAASQAKRKEFWQQNVKLDAECKTLREKIDAAETTWTKAQEQSLTELGKRDAALFDMAGQLENERAENSNAATRIAELQHEVQALSLKLTAKTRNDNETEAKLKAAVTQVNQRVAKRDAKLREINKQLISAKKAYDTLLDQSLVMSAQVTLLTERAAMPNRNASICAFGLITRSKARLGVSQRHCVGLKPLSYPNDNGIPRVFNISPV